MKRTLLVDVDSVIYAAASRHETAVQWDEDTWTSSGDFDGAKRQLDDAIGSMKSKLQGDVVVLALTNGVDPWRKKILPSYKSNRKDIRKPLLLKPLRAYCHEVYTVFERPGLEADDVIGILATATSLPEGLTSNRIICSIDKDLRTIPGQHYSWLEPDGGVSNITIEQADRFHMVQTLMGDAVDGYKGCPGVGRVKSEFILGGTTAVDEMWPRVVEAFHKAGLTEQDALVQARVARICRASDYDFKNRRVILWTPSPSSTSQNETTKPPAPARTAGSTARP